MLRSLLVLLVAAWASLSTPASALAAEAAFPPGSRIGLVLPPGDLKPSSTFPGFEDSTRKVTITILDLPGAAYESVEQSAFGKTIKGLTVDKREVFTFTHGVGYLITGHAQIGGQSEHTYYLLLNTFDRSVGQIAAFVRVHVPDAARAAYPDAAIRAALHSVTFRVPPVAELLNRVPFKLGDLAGFRVMKVMPPTLAVLIDGPTDDPIKHPYMIVSIGRGSPEQPDSRVRFARDLLATAPLKNIVITSGESMRIGGLPGYELRANATGPDGAPLAFVQWLRFGTGGFLRVIGVGPKNRWDELFPRFRAVRDGIELH